MMEWSVSFTVLGLFSYLLSWQLSVVNTAHCGQDQAADRPELCVRRVCQLYSWCCSVTCCPDSCLLLTQHIVAKTKLLHSSGLCDRRVCQLYWGCSVTCSHSRLLFLTQANCLLLTQHDVAKTKLQTALDSVIEECVSFTGVDLNTSSQCLLRWVILKDCWGVCVCVCVCVCACVCVYVGVGVTSLPCITFSHFCVEMMLTFNKCCSDF